MTEHVLVIACCKQDTKRITWKEVCKIEFWTWKVISEKFSERDDEFEQEMIQKVLQYVTYAVWIGCNSALRLHGNSVFRIDTLCSIKRFKASLCIYKGF